jgi:hypothetical protein
MADTIIAYETLIQGVNSGTAMYEVSDLCTIPVTSNDLASSGINKHVLTQLFPFSVRKCDLSNDNSLNLYLASSFSNLYVFFKKTSLTTYRITIRIGLIGGTYSTKTYAYDFNVGDIYWIQWMVYFDESSLYMWIEYGVMAINSGAALLNDGAGYLHDSTYTSANSFYNDTNIVISAGFRTDSYVGYSYDFSFKAWTIYMYWHNDIVIPKMWKNYQEEAATFVISWISVAYKTTVGIDYSVIKSNYSTSTTRLKYQDSLESNSLTDADIATQTGNALSAFDWNANVNSLIKGGTKTITDAWNKANAIPSAIQGGSKTIQDIIDLLQSLYDLLITGSTDLLSNLGEAILSFIETKITDNAWLQRLITVLVNILTQIKVTTY